MSTATAASSRALDDGSPSDPPPPRHHLAAPSPLVSAVIAACAYEVVATGVNATFGEGTMPLLANGINAFTWRTFGRRLVPGWALPAGLVGAGFVLSTAWAARARHRTG